MSDQSLDLVYNALSRLAANGVSAHATTAALARLRATSPPPSARPNTTAPGDPPPPLRADLPPLQPHPVPTQGTPLPTGTGSKAERLASLRSPVLACTRCPHLAKARTQVVFGVGNPEAELMFIGEAPGADEDLVGEPFVGMAGQLLTKIIEAMDFTRADVFITNILKCRPDVPPGSTGNRPPTHQEMEQCKPYLLQQIEIIQPRVIVTLGAISTEGLLAKPTPISKIRGTWQEFRGVPLMPTFHPAYLLRNQSAAEKRKVWEDMLLVLERLGREITPKQRGYFRSV